MRDDFSGALAAIAGSGGLLRSSEPLSLSPVLSPAASLLEDAADLLVMRKDFAAALEKCEKGCQSLEDGDPNSSEELKCSLSIVGIQALAEMDRWRDVLPWILQYYQDPECWPPKILELCILLHSKVEEPQAMLEIGSDWLHSSTNQHLPSYGLLVQLYLFHVLLPLGHLAEAEGLLQGCKALSEHQQAEAHESIEEKKHQWLRQQEECLVPEEPPDVAWKQHLGLASQKMLTVLAQLGRVVGSLAGQLCSIPYKKTLLAAVMLCLIIVKLDPASPTSLPFIYRVLHLFHQARLAVFSSHCRPPFQD
uniref:Peroxisomal biosis factor 26 n=1 Tax=Anolis carolinensis TaxID=28377 RepID=G1KMA6_ANOCA|nr:PREDICTED: peroxisome assembly protein 26 isoform X1 [Anolis carolinensis]|eukprot:XP_003220855.1 PREDICTED: peroxisome assembly protein 26 isoform X1 [Anolis carolinensis]